VGPCQHRWGVLGWKTGSPLDETRQRCQSRPRQHRPGSDRLPPLDSRHASGCDSRRGPCF